MSIKAKNCNLEVATSSVSKVRKEPSENNGDELAATRKRKEHCQHSADSSLRRPEFVAGHVSAVADAYVETLQTIAVKPSWIDSVANGRAYVFQLDSAPSHKALKIQDYMNGREFSLSCHIKLMPAS
ncbi:hypothetical protein ACTXT7_004498 [Hymenolepis weldensis]